MRTRSSSYQRLQEEIVLEDDDQEIEQLKKRTQPKPPSKAEYVSTKLHAALWIGSAVALAYCLDVLNVAFHDPRVHRLYFNIGLVCFGMNCCITLYLAVWLPYVKKIDLEWSVYCPRMIPTATIIGILCALGFILGLWPVWGFFTPGILFVLFLGSLMTAHFLPAF
ncbi:transmembrane protein [Thraustotheca clavata]|uniref:Transmembrane protein n=1 Tax=Thraustotheca clavata TaxID=74557 RepID=A0A1W0A176_9STRA|nr:transmembrane protein [Thraustotheca clavata]